MYRSLRKGAMLLCEVCVRCVFVWLVFNTYQANTFNIKVRTGWLVLISLKIETRNGLRLTVGLGLGMDLGLGV